MVRTRSLLIAVVALGLGAGACKKNEDKNAAGADKTAEKAGGAAGGAAVAAGDDLSLLPADSEMVLGLNFAQLRQSALWKQYGTKLMEKNAAEFEKFKSKCGFDPFEQVTSASLGLKGFDNDTPEGAFVVHGLDKAKTLDCVAKTKDEAAKEGTEMTVDGDVILMKSKNGETAAWTFVNANTMFGTIGKAVTKDTLLAAAKGDSGLRKSAAFVDIYSKINTKDSLWVLINGNAAFMQKASQMGVKPKAVFGSINVTDGLALDLRIRTETAEEAKSFVGTMQGQTNNPQVKQMFDKLEVTQDGTDARFVVALSNQKLQQLIGMVGGMMGGMMGGGMGAP